MTALESAFAQLGLDRPVAALVTRVLVDEEDPGWDAPSKPIGRYLDERQALARIADGERWHASGVRGWRRVVPSPRPLEILDSEPIAQLVAAGTVVVAAGGGGIPMARRDGAPRGVEAVLDKDRTAALLAEQLGADVLVIATDVDGVAIGYGSATERWLAATTPEELRELAAAGHFADGSMGPKVEAATRFVERTGRRAAVASLDRILEATVGRAGTAVLPFART